MKYKVADLKGALLDAAVAKAEGATVLPGFIEWPESEPLEPFRIHGYSPSIEWADGGPIIERERITLGLVTEVGPWSACLDHSAGRTKQGPTALIAAMRAYVASKFDDEVDLP